ncbi:ABC transporter permease subunit [Streptomyces liangshanensis]|uniref:ABC transporter permease subunit n=1 Tax=Streptomyces liangshanensis TaxID=2717324 RepID=A0A6G9GWS3_9ACTN|nr:ABC transporter permease subunit [Streptomyces liangshanensis]QIQ02660.1 ABC transporter permease subunit [Streptomyces liangshanensis]
MTTPYQQHAPQQPAPQWGAGPVGGYVSPIPVRRATLGDAVASEWTKLRSVRSTMWTLGVMLVLMVGIGTLTAWVVSASSTESINDDVLTLGFFGVLLGSICVITLGVLTISSEYSTGMIRTTLTACPSRVRVLGAKSLVFFLLIFVLVVVTTALVGALQVAITDAPSPSGEVWFRSTVGVSLFVATLGLLSLAVGALIRHSAGAITIMIGVVLLPLVLAMFMFADSLDGLRDALFNYSIPNMLAALYDNTGVSTDSSGPTGWLPLWIMIGVTVVAMTGAFFSLDRRDV